MYIDVGPDEGGSADLRFMFDINNMDMDNMNMRTWEIKVTQIPCFAPNRYELEDFFPLINCYLIFANLRPPPGCLQYFMETTDMIQTFNFNNGNGNHLAEQDYSACIRQNEGIIFWNILNFYKLCIIIKKIGFCCVQFRVCDVMQMQFDLDGKFATAMLESDCTTDYVTIEGKSII